LLRCFRCRLSKAVPGANVLAGAVVACRPVPLLPGSIRRENDARTARRYARWVDQPAVNQTNARPVTAAVAQRRLSSSSWRPAAASVAALSCILSHSVYLCQCLASTFDLSYAASYGVFCIEIREVQSAASLVYDVWYSIVQMKSTTDAAAGVTMTTSK